jgi:hypothetical protein
MIEMVELPKSPLKCVTAIGCTSKVSRKEPTTEVMPSEMCEGRGINPSESEFDQPGPSRRVLLVNNFFVEEGEMAETTL